MDDLDVTQALKDAENSLRDFIALVLSRSKGEGWEDSCGVTPTRITAWKDRKAVEEKRQAGGVVEERLIYYADFYDLPEIIKSNWQGAFEETFGKQKEILVLFDIMQRLRDPDAHRRELLTHQKHLVLGIAGEIRSRIVRYRSKMETPADYFPRIESVCDNYGTLWVPDMSKFLNTGKTLRVGDELEFIIKASDPEDLPLEYGLLCEGGGGVWQESNILRLQVKKQHVGLKRMQIVQIRSRRDYHARSNSDDYITFQYDILPDSRRTSSDISDNNGAD